MKITKKQLFIMYGTMLLLILFSTIFGYSDNNYKPKYGLTTANVNLRLSANLETSSIVKVIPKNTNLKIVGDINDYYIVQTKNNEIGLVFKSYIKLDTTTLENALVYESLTKYYATINSNNTNLRGGPSTSFKSYAKLAKGDIVEVIGKINDWNLVITVTNKVGMIREDLITKSTASGNPITNPNTNNDKNNQVPTDNNVTLVLDLINKARKENNLNPLTLDNALTKVAQTKANDMVKNDYFAHNSPTYGSPFEMMQSMSISYKSAGENIAGNPSIEDAVNSWLNSQTHNKNILSTKYNYIGIGIEKSNTYGYIIVAMFIEK